MSSNYVMLYLMCTFDSAVENLIKDNKKTKELDEKDLIASAGCSLGFIIEGFAEKYIAPEHQDDFKKELSDQINPSDSSKQAH